jgi:hypothetical protein
MILMLHSSIWAQTEFSQQMQNFHVQRMDINRTAMLVLGSWAVGNIITGTYGNFKAQGEAKYFHQFNAMWNVVNLGIATFGYLGAANYDLNTLSNTEILNEYYSLQSFLLLNAGLDVAYMSIGLYLRERAKNASSYDRLRGYGNSMLLQGGFLLVFDIALYFIHQNNANIQLYPILQNTIDGAIGAGITYTW